MSDDVDNTGFDSMDTLSDTSGDVGNAVPSDLPADIPEDVPDSGGDGLAVDAASEGQEDLPEDESENDDASSDTSGDVSNAVPDDLPADIPEDVTDSGGGGLAGDAASDGQEEIPEDVPEGASIDALKDTPEKSNTNISEEQLQETPKATSDKEPSEQSADQPEEDQAEKDQPKDDQPKDDQPKDDQPKDDQPKDDQPKDDQPKDDQPKDDQPKDDQPKDDQPKDDQSKGLAADIKKMGLNDETRNGVDIPDETDYFTDKERAEKTLSDFRPANWEQQNLDDKKQSIEQLANYHADILGIDNKPGVSYYNNRDPRDFGGYSPSANVLSINEDNLGDGPETVDTVSHEYRHAYQRQRSENPENERDFMFQDNFRNYTKPEEDYEEYKNQILERDAREYAQRFKDYPKC
jgi:hypothetical protein